MFYEYFSETPEPPKREDNPFSLKHFLNRDQSQLSSGIHAKVNPHSTGARPKVLQNDISTNGLPNKMKRSPRFPSFDSQASLNEYKRDVSPSMNNLLLSRSNTSFTSISCGLSDNRAYSPSNEFQRSFSNYDIESPKTSPRCERKNINNRNCEFSSALPDFVQDHLVVEQLYNAFYSPPATTSPLTLEDDDNRPDFNEIMSRVRPEALDLTFNPNASMPNRTISSPIPLDLPNNTHEISLDLPNNKNPRRDGRRNPISADLTLDLTGTSIESRSAYMFPSSSCGGNNADMHIPESNKIQTLPDFLSDGPIHSSGRLADVAQDLPAHIDSPEDESMNTIMARLRLENGRLRMELDESRRALSERTRRVRALERIIENERNNENQYTATLTHSMEQVEENLDRSNVSILIKINLRLN